MTRRGFLKGLLGTFLVGLFVTVYGFLIEPMLRLRVKTWRISPPAWRKGQALKIAIVSDPHCVEPHMTLKRFQRILTRVNALGADMIVVLGDYQASHPFSSKPVPMTQIANALTALTAPLGVFAILGNHDWWDDKTAQRNRSGPTKVHEALNGAGIHILENDAIKIGKDDQAFWLLGLGDQLAFINGGRRFAGVDDLPGTLAQVTDDAPVILLAHEPDIFPKVPDRVALTLSGHTHGGQIRLFGFSPVVPSRFGNRFAYGHVREGQRDIVISGGLGCSIAPVRFGVTPEITLVELS